jgi:fatty acid desaturase
MLRGDEDGVDERTGTLGAYTTIASFLGQPAGAVVLGLALGVGSVIFSRISASFMTPEDATLGLARVALAMVLRLAVVVGALACYFAWARAALAPFGIALIAGFMVTVTVETFGAGRTPKTAIHEEAGS